MGKHLPEEPKQSVIRWWKSSAHSQHNRNAASWRDGWLGEDVEVRYGMDRAPERLRDSSYWKNKELESPSSWQQPATGQRDEVERETGPQRTAGPQTNVGQDNGLC